jgi:glycosyltransferase XagB
LLQVLAVYTALANDEPAALLWNGSLLPYSAALERPRALIPQREFYAAIAQSFRDALRYKATFFLDSATPWLSARNTLTGGLALAALLGIAIISSWLAPKSFLVLALLASTLFFTSGLIRLWAVFTHAPKPPLKRPSLDNDLPGYTILVPLFKEAGVLSQLLQALSALDYPSHLLDIKLIIEEEDVAMRRALMRHSLPTHVQVLIVPDGKPRTKPRALNYGLLFARGDYLTIYDAEDVPSRLQLREAAQALLRSDPDVACVQAKLAFYNANENWITRQLALEYAVLFGAVQQVLTLAGLPLPLCGTSNHFKIAQLRAVGGWDPFNVTEDADLGFRLARSGWRTGIIASVTFEEAVTDIRSWQRQRARWLKGFLQTFLVHARNPRWLFHELGFAAAWMSLVLTFGTWLNALCHPILAVWCIVTVFAAKTDRAFDIALMGLASLFFNYFVFALLARRELIAVYGVSWLAPLLTFPFYWFITSIAALRALVELLLMPHHWHKTEHDVSVFRQTNTARSEAHHRNTS